MAMEAKIKHGEFVRLWNEGLTIREIAKHFGCCKQAVSKHAQMHPEECPKRKRGRRQIYSHEPVIELRNKGLSAREISEKLHISKPLVTKYLKAHKEECLFVTKRKKVSEAEFVAMWEAKLPVRDIAAKFDISEKYVRNYAGKHGLRRRVKEVL